MNLEQTYFAKFQFLSSLTPINIGSGVNSSNVAASLKYSGGAIVGTYLKKDGIVYNEVDVERVKTLILLTCPAGIVLLYFLEVIGSDNEGL